MGDHAIPATTTSSCIWVAIPVGWVILYRYVCGADGRAYGQVITKISRMGRLPHFFRLGELRYNKMFFVFFSDFNTDAKLIRTLLLFPGIVPQWLRSDRIGLYSFHFRISKSRAFPSVFFAKRTRFRVTTLSISQNWLARPVILKKRYYSFFLQPITAVHTI